MAKLFNSLSATAVATASLMKPFIKAPPSPPTPDLPKAQWRLPQTHGQPERRVQRHGRELARAEAATRLNYARATLDSYASVCSCFLVLLFFLGLKQQGQLVPSFVWLVLTSHSICPLARWALGRSQYAALRALPVAAARLLTVHAAVLYCSCGMLPVSSQDQAWPRFLWHLSIVSAAVSQLWVSLMWQLPLGQHVALTLLTAADFLAHLPGMCSGVSAGGVQGGMEAVWQGCATSVGSVDAAGTSIACPPFLFDHAAGRFQAPTDLLDWCFANLGKGRLEDMHPVSEGALCAGVLVWTHLAFAVVGSSLAVYVLECRAGLHCRRGTEMAERVAARQADQEEAELEYFERERGRQGVRGMDLLLPNGSVRDAGLSALFFAQMLWCMVRVLCIRLP